MSSFDSGSLLRQIAQDFVDGLRNEGTLDFASQVCTVKTRPSMKGSEAYRASVHSLAKDLGGQAIGSDPVAISQAMSSLDWNMVRYSNGTSLDQSEIEDLEQYMDPIGEYTSTLVEYVDVSIESDLLTLLTNASFNGSSAAANGVWSLPSSTPVEDMQTIKSAKAPGANMVIVGHQTALELIRHTDMKESSSYYSGGGALEGGYAALRATIGNILGISPADVSIWDTFYNTSLEGQAASVGYIAGDVFWVGNKRGLLCVEQTTSGQATTVEKHLQVELAYSKTLDLIRIDPLLGAYMTGL